MRGAIPAITKGKIMKVLTGSEEATKYENDPEYITKEIVVENGVKFAVIEKIGEKPVEKVEKKNDKK